MNHDVMPEQDKPLPVSVWTLLAGNQAAAARLVPTAPYYAKTGGIRKATGFRRDVPVQHTPAQTASLQRLMGSKPTARRGITMVAQGAPVLSPRAPVAAHRRGGMSLKFATHAARSGAAIAARKRNPNAILFASSAVPAFVPQASALDMIMHGQYRRREMDMAAQFAYLARIKDAHMLRIANNNYDWADGQANSASQKAAQNRYGRSRRILSL